MTIWEFNAYMDGYTFSVKQSSIQCILTGYYTAYYMNGGKKAKSPDQLIHKLYEPKQNFEEGISDIKKIKEFEKEVLKNGYCQKE